MWVYVEDISGWVGHICRFLCNDSPLLRKNQRHVLTTQATFGRLKIDTVVMAEQECILRGSEAASNEPDAMLQHGIIHTLAARAILRDWEEVQNHTRAIAHSLVHQS